MRGDEENSPTSNKILPKSENIIRSYLLVEKNTSIVDSI